MDNAIQAVLYAQGQPASSIPHSRPTCCCDTADCIRLRHNQTALEDLERDVRTAANLGQALLTRHETYVAESERERERMMAQIETLETDKLALEQSNAHVIEQNRSLLDQLESVNNAVSDSDAHVTALQATLFSAQQEMQRLSHLAGRTERLERQIAELEMEQATWQTTLETTTLSEKSAIQRWQKAERTLADFEEQMIQIEQEAKKERERHLEVVARMERRYAVEGELKSSTHRADGTTAPARQESQNVVSHFVKDILQDNATLQLGIVELREMLQTSNDEVENLRAQLIEHEPFQSQNANEDNVSRKDLQDELSRAKSSEYHIHHHYHAPTATSKPPPIRRIKKKRYGAFTSGSSTPSYGTPRSSISYLPPSSAATILDHTAVTVPQSVPGSKRASVQSMQSAYSTSVPGSPTTNRTSSMYERVFSDAGLDSSRPTTPDTEDPGSPFLVPAASFNVKRGPNNSFRTRGEVSGVRGITASSALRPSLSSIADASIENLSIYATTENDLPSKAIPEESEGEWGDASSPDLVTDTAITSPFSEDIITPLDVQNSYKPRLRQAASHESILSVAGLDIHTLKARPSQLLAPYGGRSFTAQAAIGDAHTEFARPSTLSRPSDSSLSVLSGMALGPRQGPRPSLGQKVGGWVFGRWGQSPAITVTSSEQATTTSRIKTPSIASSEDTRRTDPDATPKKFKHRTPGINQSGPIFGLGPETRRVLAPPVMRTLDEEALKMALGD